MPVVKGMPIPNCGLLKALCWGFPSCRTRGGFLPILPFGTCNRPSSEGCGLEKGPPQTGVALSGPGQGRMSTGLGPQGRCDLDSKCTQVQRGQAGPVVCGPGHDQVCHLPVKIVQWPLGLTLDSFGSVPPSSLSLLFPWGFPLGFCLFPAPEGVARGNHQGCVPSTRGSGGYLTSPHLFCTPAPRVDGKELPPKSWRESKPEYGGFQPVSSDPKNAWPACGPRNGLVGPLQSCGKPSGKVSSWGRVWVQGSPP